MSQLTSNKGNVYDENAMTDEKGKIKSQTLQVFVSPNEQPTLLSQNFVYDGFNTPKIPCLYHKGNILTNFCSCIQCLLPLCPQCVEEHIIKHKEEQTSNKIECLENVLNTVYKNIVQESLNIILTLLANFFAKSYFDLKNNVDSMAYATDNTINKLLDIQNRIIRVVEQFFKSLINDVQNKQKKNQQNQEKDAESLKQLVQQRWSSHVTFLETLNSENSMTSVIQFFGTSLLEDNDKYFNILDQYSNRFEQVTSDIIFNQEKAIEIAAHLSHIIKIRHNDVPEFIKIHTLPSPNISDAVSFHSKTPSHIKPSQPLYPSIQQPAFTPPQHVITGATRILDSGTFYTDKRYTDSLNRLPQYQMR
ncbi:unnamed protein product (macronuclear) [Paramecium tetraurelia]|uniref:B box-type domain-containing protein n=1 Tax=Paramecium tetraurelia TaxID=5888 RepID=A0D949_PARTE|nr:uncharacterized protein GSPATT00014512001 [Paramecium tetraurelia]CAK79566.1 unnamed protein product [Paramecium tetraurelia]|eukprot:XP_001446963.1 hypothetical protein (macronuclear) [Paramecium tetraurelia strain d4-2]